MADGAGNAGAGAGAASTTVVNDQGGAGAAGAANAGSSGAVGSAGAAGGAAGTAGAGAGAAGAGGAGQGAQGGSGGAAGDAGTAATGNDGGDGANWGAKWREDWAGTDEKKLKWAQRYAGPREMIEAGWNASQKIASGQVRAPLPENPSAEQLAQYRKDNGIPETADGYLANLPAEIKVSDADKPIVGKYLEALHAQNLPPKVVHSLLQAREQILEGLIDQQQETDRTSKQEVEDTLRREWGDPANYTANINGIRSVLDSAPEEVKQAFMSARTPDGKPLFGTAEAVRWFAQLAREINPAPSIVSSGGGMLDARGVDDRITQIESMMRAPRGTSEYKGYWDNPKTQAEYRELIDAREKMKKRAA